MFLIVKHIISLLKQEKVRKNTDFFEKQTNEQQQNVFNCQKGCQNYSFFKKKAF